MSQRCLIAGDAILLGQGTILRTLLTHQKLRGTINRHANDQLPRRKGRFLVHERAAIQRPKAGAFPQQQTHNIHLRARAPHRDAFQLLHERRPKIPPRQKRHARLPAAQVLRLRPCAHAEPGWRSPRALPNGRLEPESEPLLQQP